MTHNPKPTLEEMTALIAEERKARPDAVARCYAVFNATQATRYNDHEEYLKASAIYVLEELKAHAEGG